MQEFGYRVWNNIEKRYLNDRYGLYVESNPNIEFQFTRVIAKKDYYKKDFFNSDNNFLELELFTGLYDKNGKKIYEGDIIRSYEKGEYFNKNIKVNFDMIDGINFSYFVRDNQISLEFFDIFEYKYSLAYYIRSKEPMYMMEVIGNINENEDLLI